MNLLTLSWKNLLHKPLHMGLSLLLFTLGVGLVSFLLVLNRQVQDQFDENLAGIDMIIGAKGSPLQLVLSSMYHVDAPTGNILVKDARPFLNPKHPLISQAIPVSLGDNYHGYRIVGTTPAFADLYGGKIREGRFWGDHLEAVIGVGVAQKFGLKIGSQFQSGHGLAENPDLLHGDAPAFEVVGIFEKTGAVLDQLILVDEHSMEVVHGHHHHHDGEGAGADSSEITALLVKFRVRNHMTLSLPNNINENTPLMAASPAIELSRIYSRLGVGMDALQVLAFVIIGVSALSVLVSLVLSLKERKYELALMRVVGASRWKLFLLVVLEGLLLAGMSCVLGLGLSHLALEGLAGWVEESYRYTFSGRVFLAEELYLLGAAFGVGFLAALLPAVQASRTDISRVLQ